MKIGTNFNTLSFRNAEKACRETYGDDFLITRFHRIYFYIKHVFHFFSLAILVVAALLVTRYGYVSALPYIIGLIIWMLILLYYGHTKYRSSFVLVNKDEIVIYAQQSLLKRNIHIILMKNIGGVTVDSPSVLCTFLGYGTITIFNQASNESEVIPYFPKAQQNQKFIREIGNLS